MPRCINCKTGNAVGFVIFLDNLKITKSPFTDFYPICSKCQEVQLKPLLIIPNTVKQIKDYEERTEELQRARSLCKKCFQPLNEGHWCIIFISPSNYVRHTTYVHQKCAKEVQVGLGIITKGVEQIGIF